MCYAVAAALGPEIVFTPHISYYFYQFDGMPQPSAPQPQRSAQEIFLT